jgi:hypothetical protein
VSIGTAAARGWRQPASRVTPLPGRAGVTLDYETYVAARDVEKVLGHAEHTVLARTPNAGTILVVAHVHADSVAVMHEKEPGFFAAAEDASPFPVAIRMSMPEPGRLLHTWLYGRPGEEAVERDVAELRLV